MFGERRRFVMTWRSTGIVVIAGAVCVASASCGLLTGGRSPAPPADSAKAVQWWADRIADTPPDFLAVYVEAAEVHRRQGTAATYVEFRGGHNMLGKVGTEIRLPCPPPDDVLVTMRQKAGNCAPSDHFLAAEGCRGCTPEAAERIWREAATRAAERHRGE